MYRYKQVFWVSCVGPGARLVVKVSEGGGGASCVEAPLFKFFRINIKWYTLGLKHFCAGGGGVM